MENLYVVIESRHECGNKTKNYTDKILDWNKLPSYFEDVYVQAWAYEPRWTVNVRCKDCAWYQADFQLSGGKEEAREKLSEEIQKIVSWVAIFRDEYQSYAQKMGYAACLPKSA